MSYSSQDNTVRTKQAGRNLRYVSLEGWECSMNRVQQVLQNICGGFMAPPKALRKVTPQVVFSHQSTQSCFLARPSMHQGKKWLAWSPATVTHHKPQSGQNGKQQLHAKNWMKWRRRRQPKVSRHDTTAGRRLFSLSSQPISHSPRTSLEGPSLHPESGEGRPGVVKRRIRHGSSAVRRPAGTGARSDWSSGIQREGEEERREESRGRERERESTPGWGLPPTRLRWSERQSRQAKKSGCREKETWRMQQFSPQHDRSSFV